MRMEEAKVCALASLCFSESPAGWQGLENRWFCCRGAQCAPVLSETAARPAVQSADCRITAVPPSGLRAHIVRPYKDLSLTVRPCNDL